jgi:hypothetical protein
MRPSRRPLASAPARPDADFVTGTPARLPLAFVLCTPLVGCQPSTSKPEADVSAKKASESPSEASEAPPQPEPQPQAQPQPQPQPTPEPSPILYFVGQQLWRINADGTDPRALGLAVPLEYPATREAVFTTETSPAASPDGRWLVYTDEVDLWVAELGPQSATPRQITKMPALRDGYIAAANIWFSTWSPDSTTLIVTLAEPSYMDDGPQPLPKEYAYGQQLLRTGALALAPAPHLPAWSGWSPDSRAIISANEQGSIIEVPLEPGPEKQLRAVAGKVPQLRISGDWLAWVGGDDPFQAFVAPLAAGEPKPMSPKGGWAEIQWPVAAPDGGHIVFVRQPEANQRMHQISAGPDDASVVTVPTPVHGADWQWLDPSRLIAVTSAGLVTVDLTAKVSVLDPAATWLTRR